MSLSSRIQLQYAYSVLDRNELMQNQEYNHSEGSLQDRRPINATPLRVANPSDE